MKEDLNWDGMIVTDWADINNLYTREAVAADKKEAIEIAINAGIDMTMEPYERTTGISPPAEKVVSALSAFLSFKEVATIENVTFSLKERKFANENSKSIT